MSVTEHGDRSDDHAGGAPAAPAACIVCESSDFLDLYPRYSAVPNRLCRDCGLVFQPGADESHISRYYYTDGYHKRSVSRSVRTANVSRSLLRHSAKPRVKALRAVLPGGIDGRRVLDIGCGYGAIISTLRDEYDCDVVGLDPAPQAAEHARRFFELELTPVTLQDYQTARPFDVILAIHSLEHVPDPAAFLRKTGELLAPGGHVFLECPNFLHPSCGFPMRRFLEKDHLFNFTLAPLTTLCRRAGFNVVREDAKRALTVVLERSPMPGREPPGTTTELQRNAIAARKFLKTYPLQRQLRFYPLRRAVFLAVYVAKLLYFKARDAATVT